uniref:Uncharacterized protein LOC100185798 n=1 Tax=Phallusia mammillata TaxID=59560 RepID=A0A6F9DIZ2_9ASCI|nr:uncharacterized protein LOC100185798 [Phallusia mammillata]
MVERSRSVTPQHWAARPTTPRHFMNEVVQSAYDTSDDERHRYMEQQHQSAQAEKSQRLKEQYSKLQMLQRKQRMVEKKHVPNPKHKTSSIPSYQVTNMQAKSSDV